MFEPSSSPDLDRVTGLVSRRFSVMERYIESGILTFSIDPHSPDVKNSFEGLVRELKSEGQVPFLRKAGDVLLIRVFGRPQTGRRSNRTALILLVITATVIFVHGYLLGSDELWATHLTPSFPPYLYGVTFTAALLGIIATHELGHLTLLRRNKIESSLPYFIPGIPGLGPFTPPTFGAVIVQREVPPNRDRLFDLGISGPLFGLVATVVVAVLAALSAPILPNAQVALIEEALSRSFMEAPSPSLPIPALLQIIMNLVLPPVGEDSTVILPLIFGAAWVGMLITFLNALPAWQLDGGHLARAVLGERMHVYTTLASVAFLMIIGFWPMAFLVLLLWTMSGGKVAGPLDDYSKVTTGRKLMFVALLIIAGLSAPLPFSIV